MNENNRGTSGGIGLSVILFIGESNPSHLKIINNTQE